MLLQWWLFGVRPGLLSSVQGRFRWRWFGRVTRWIVPVLAAYGIAAVLVVPSGPIRFDAEALGLLLVVVLTTPLQAVAEEYAMRGLVQRSIGSWFDDAGAALVVSTAGASILFALMHASPDPWRVVFYLSLGVAASLAAWGTGGLEASVIIHAANNLIIALPAAFSGGSTDFVARDTEVGTIAAVPTLVVLMCGGIAVWLARRAGLTRTQDIDAKELA